MVFRKTNFLTFTLSAVFVIAFVGGCNEAEEDVVPEERAEEVNMRPYPFQVTVVKVGSDYAVIDWGPAADENNDPLYHSVYLEDVIVAERLRKDSLYTFADLQPQKSYSGKIVVTDDITEPVEVPFSFSTKKRFTTFSRLFQGYNGRSPRGMSMAVTSDGGYVVSGSISFDHNGYGHYLGKMDSLGYEQWSTLVEDHGEFGGGIVQQTTDGGYVVVSSHDLIRFNQSGTVQWQANGMLFNSIIETSNGEFLAIADGGVIARYDDSGSLLWQKYYDQNDYTFGEYIASAGDGNFVICGTKGVYGANDLSMTKVDESGNVLWSQLYKNDNSHDFPTQAKLTSDGGFIIASNTIGTYDVNYARVVKVDIDGNLKWEKEFLWDSFKTYCNAIAPTADGSYVFVGSNGYSPAEALMVKLDSSGELLWKKHYKPSYPDYSWGFRAVHMMPDGGMTVLGGKGAIWSFDGKELGMWLMRTNDEGEL